MPQDNGCRDDVPGVYEALAVDVSVSGRILVGAIHNPFAEFRHGDIRALERAAELLRAQLHAAMTPGYRVYAEVDYASLEMRVGFAAFAAFDKRSRRASLTRAARFNPTPVERAVEAQQRAFEAQLSRRALMLRSPLLASLLTFMP